VSKTLPMLASLTYRPFRLAFLCFWVQIATSPSECFCRLISLSHSNDNIQTAIYVIKFNLVLEHREMIQTDRKWLIG